MPANVETMAYVKVTERDVPWHGLGTPVPGVMTIEEALEAGGLNWTVSLESVYVRRKGKFVEIQDGVWYIVLDGDHTLAKFDDRDEADEFVRNHRDKKPRIITKPRSPLFAVTRSTDERVLGTVREKYVPFQNREALEFADNLVDSGDAHYETVGALKGGRIVWAAMKRPDHILIGGEDEVEVYLLITTSHDGTRAIQVAVTPIRVVCENTLNLGLSAARQRWSVRHISTATQRLQEAREALALSFTYTDAFQMQAEALLAEAMNEREFASFATILLKDEPGTDENKVKVVESMTGLFTESPTLEGIRGTKWGALNAIGEHLDWNDKIKTAEARFKFTTQTGGKAINLRNRALELLTIPA